MAATALIQFTQGANTDAAGKAVLGDYGDFSEVTVTNGDNTDVVSWTIYLLDAPADSGDFPPGDQPQILAAATDATPTIDFTPDVAGTYRVMLEVVDSLGNIDRDIRCFGIPDGQGFVLPPYQQFPEPLPIELPVMITLDPRPSKPDEQNYGDNVRGWAGNGDLRQLDAFLKQHADLPYQTVTATPFTATAADPPLHLVDVTTIGVPAVFKLPLSARVGYVSRVAVQGIGFPVRVEPQGGGAIDGTPAVEINAGGISFAHRGSNQWVTLSSARPRGTFHVDDFGAIPRSFYGLAPHLVTEEERTANVNAINAALEAAKVGLPPGVIGPGGTVYIGPGTYYTNGAVGYDLAIDVNIGVTFQGLGPFPTMISSNNDDEEVFKLYTSSGNIRMFYMKDIGIYGGRTGISLVRACYNRFDNIFFWGSHQFALSSYLGFQNVFHACYTTDTSQFGGDAAIFVSCADILSDWTFGESSGAVFVYDGNLQINGAVGYGMYYRGGPFYTDYWTTPGSPVNVTLAFWAGDVSAFFGSNSMMQFTNLRMSVPKSFLTLSGAQDLIMNGCWLVAGDNTIGGPELFSGFIDLKQSFGATALSINGGQFIFRNGTSGYFIREPSAVLHDAVIQTQLIKEGTAVITPLSSSAPALLNPGSENNFVVARTLSRA